MSQDRNTNDNCCKGLSEEFCCQTAEKPEKSGCGGGCSSGAKEQKPENPTPEDSTPKSSTPEVKKGGCGGGCGPSCG